MDPTQQFLVTNSREPVLQAAKTSEAGGQATQNEYGQKPESNPTWRCASFAGHRPGDAGERAFSTVHFAYQLRWLPGEPASMGEEWLLNLKYFSGGSRIMGRVESSCAPLFDFLSQAGGAGNDVHTAGRGQAGGDDGPKDAAFGTRRLRMRRCGRWWCGRRTARGLAREALAVSHPVRAGSTIDQGDIKGQIGGGSGRGGRQGSY